MPTRIFDISMSIGKRPRQRLFQLVDLPRPPQGLEVLTSFALTGLEPNEPGQDAEPVVQAEWSWSPMHNRISNWQVGLDTTGQYWLLWLCDRTEECEQVDEYDPDEWDGYVYVEVWIPELVAACPRDGLSAHDASIWLLAEAWAGERDSEAELSRPQVYSWAGLLGIDVIRTIEYAVWPPGRP